MEGNSSERCVGAGIKIKLIMSRVFKIYRDRGGAAIIV